MSTFFARRWQWSRHHQGILLSLVLVCTTAAVAQVNAVYIENNVGQLPNKNSIIALKNDGTGKLSPITSGSFLTNGTGVFATPKVGSPSLQADNEVVVNAAGTLLLAVNGGSNTISVFGIANNGVLTLLSTTPFPSLGSDPVSIGLDENSPAGPYVLVVNQAADPAQPGQTPNIVGFFLDETTGTLTPANSSISYPDGSLPAQALASPSGKFEYVVQFMGGGSLCSFSVGAGGLLNANNCFLPNLDPVFLGAAVHPKQRVVYVGQPAASVISVFTYNNAGNLAFQRVFANTGSLICWLTTNKAGTRLYTVESGATGAGSPLTVYDISGANFVAPVQLQHFTMTNLGDNATNLKLDPTEKFLYVLSVNESNTAGNFVHVLNVATDGTLTETLTPLKLPIHAGEIPQGLAVAMH
jgi:6-phosphogluconolactonase (cycloisomerase 2 family)